MSEETGDVMVVTYDRQFVGYVSWAIARRTLKENRASVLRSSPFTIRLPYGEHSLPSFRAKKGNNTMSRGYNWAQIFKTESDVWLQNLSPTQLSISFRLSDTLNDSVLIPPGTDPIRITDRIPFKSIADSNELRRFLTKTPAVCRLLTEAEAIRYYETLARQRGLPDAQAAIEQTAEERDAARRQQSGESTTYVDQNGEVRFTLPKTAQVLAGLIGDKAATPLAPQVAAMDRNAAAYRNAAPEAENNDAPEPIHPKAVDVCFQASQRDNPWTAEQTMTALRPYEGSFNASTFQYIESHGRWPTVKKWAQANVVRLLAPPQEEEAAVGG